MAADGASSSMKVSDITHCSICLETYKEPKALPCIHTFCLQCLDKHCEDMEQKDVACPLCRKGFQIPPGGNTNLPDNFFILQLLQVKQSSSEAEKEVNRKHLCGLCSDAVAEISSTSYCIECDEHMCDRCSMTHKKLKLTKNHQVTREDEYSGAAKRIKLSSSCDQHPAEQTRLYCYDCKMVACHVCFVKKHSKHYLTDVNESAEKFREQIKDDVNNLSTFASNKWQKIVQLEKDKSAFVEKIATTEIEISQKYDQLISLLQSHKIELMEELNAFKDKVLKEVKTVKDEIERQLVITESFKRYCQEMMDKGTACDISRTAHDLHVRAEELVKTPDEPDCHRVSEVEITVKPFLSTTDCAKNFIGKLVCQGEINHNEESRKFDFTMLLESLPIIHVMPDTGNDISGVTVLGSEVFVTRGTSEVSIYESDDFTLIRELMIPGGGCLRGLVSCSHYNCLYAVDFEQQIIYRYDLTNSVTTNWGIGGECCGLSVTKRYNILATACDTRQIHEYTTTGMLASIISLDSSIYCPRHCVQLSTGNYVVGHVDPLCQGSKICIVDQKGRIIQSYGTSADENTELPCHLAVDMHDNVLVADNGCRRVQIFNRPLTYLGDVDTSGFPLFRPTFVYFDELYHRLYIGESYNDYDDEVTGGRLLVLDVNLTRNI